MMAETLERGDEDELAMLKERKKDCTEFGKKSLNPRDTEQRRD